MAISPLALPLYLGWAPDNRAEQPLRQVSFPPGNRSPSFVTGPRPVTGMVSKLLPIIPMALWLPVLVNLGLCWPLGPAWAIHSVRHVNIANANECGLQRELQTDRWLGLDNLI